MILLDRERLIPIVAVAALVVMTVLASIVSNPVQDCILAEPEDTVDADSFEGQFHTGETCEAAATMCMLSTSCTIRTVLQQTVMVSDIAGFWGDRP